MTAPRTPPPRGLRRVERWFVGLALALVAFILERLVLRAVRRTAPTVPEDDAEATTFTSRGGEVDLPEL